MFHEDKAINSILYLLNINGGKMKINKLFRLLFLGDRYHLSKYGRLITDDTYQTSNEGPIPINIKALIQTTDNIFLWHLEILSAEISPNLNYLSQSDINALEYATNHMETSDCKIGYSIPLGKVLSIEDILKDYGETMPYIEYIKEKIKVKQYFLR